jgi:hypothetical protein
MLSIGQTDRDAGDSAESALTARVVSEAQRSFSHLADGTEITRVAESTVRQLFRDSIRVTSFVPVLALREIRDMLEGEWRAAPPRSEQG